MVLTQVLEQRCFVCKKQFVVLCPDLSLPSQLADGRQVGSVVPGERHTIQAFGGTVGIASWRCKRSLPVGEKTLIVESRCEAVQGTPDGSADEDT